MSSASFLMWLTKRPALWGFISSATRGFCSVARNSLSCVAQVRSVNFPSSHAPTIAAGLPPDRDQRGHDDVGIEHNAHEALSGYLEDRRAVRTSLTASSTIR